MILKEFFRKLVGKVYVINTRTKEIHSEKLARKVCKIDKMLPANKKYVTFREAKRLLQEEGYDKCDWCFKIRKDTLE